MNQDPETLYRYSLAKLIRDLEFMESTQYLHLVFLQWEDQIVVWVLKLSNEKQRRRESQPEEE